MSSRLLIVVAVLTFAATASAEGVIGIPSAGLDLVLLDDGRILQCKVGAKDKGKIELEFPSVRVYVPKERIVKIRLFKDFDSTPVTEEEKKKVAKGEVKWAGRWLSAKRAAKLRETEEAPIRERQAVDLAHAKWEDRWHYPTKHFVFESNLKREALDFFVTLLEDYYTHITKHFRIKLTQRDRKKKLPVYALGSREEFMAFHEKDTGGESEHTLGYFVPDPGNERLVFFDQPGGRKETVATLLHEGTHFVLHLAEPQVILPRWVHEGMAEYYGASERQGDDFVPGGVQDGRLLQFLEMARRDKLVPMRELFIAGNRILPDDVSTIQFESPHYAQSWIIVHYLMKANKGKLSKRWIDYLNRWLTGKGISYTSIQASDQKTLLPADDEALLLRCLKIKNTDQLLKAVIAYAKKLELRSPVAYVERGVYIYWAEKDESAANEAFKKAMDQGGKNPEVLLALARAFSQIPGRSGEVLGLLETALDIDPLDVGVRYIYSGLVDPREMLREIRVCTEIDPNHARALGSLAWLLYRDKMQSGYRAVGPDLDIANEALDLARRAVALDPSADNLDTIAALYLVLGKFPEARDHATRAVQLEPERMGYLSRLARAHAVSGDRSKFVKTLRRVEMLLSRPDEETGRARAEEQVKEELDDIVVRTLYLCDVWDKKKEALDAADGWFRRRPPGTADGWAAYVNAVKRGEGPKRALELAKQGAEAFPDNFDLQEWIDKLTKEMKE